MGTDNGVFRCDYCRNVVAPEKNDEGVSVLSEAPDAQACPVCSIPLMQAALAKLPILYCGKCHGMLASMEVFPQLIAADRVQQRAGAAGPSANPGDLRRTIACPHCHRPMEAHFYAGPGNVVIDTCETCSLNWLDHGELARIAHAPADDFADSDPDSSPDPDRYKASDYDIATDPHYDSNAPSW